MTNNNLCVCLSSNGHPSNSSHPLFVDCKHYAFPGDHSSQNFCFDLYPFQFAYEVVSVDIPRIKRLVEKTGFFTPQETDVAVELVNERIHRGNESGYFFVIANTQESLAGYACYGPIPCTQSSFSLYWIAVDPIFQGHGVGKRIIKEVEDQIRNVDGTSVYVETSMKKQYHSTHLFYKRQGYRLVSVLKDFYAPGDSKGTYYKKLLNFKTI